MSYNKETGMYEGYIYCITNTVNGKQYIGQTIRTIEQRYSGHIEKSKHNKDNQYLYTAMNKYGIEKFYVSQLEFISCKTKQELVDELNKKEIYYISTLNTKKPNGYNMTDGGVLLPNTYEKKPVCNYDLERNFINDFESASEAARYYNISQADITHCCNREKVQIVGGFIWRFKNDDYDVKTIKLNTRVIYQYDLQGNFLNKYYGVTEAEKSTGISNITSCCKGRNKTAGGYVWRYAEDSFDKYDVPKYYTIDMYDIDKNFIFSFSSPKEAESITGISSSNISEACSKNNRTAGGYFWIKSFDDIQNKNLPNKYSRMLRYSKEKIYKFNKENNEVIDIYNDVYDASENSGYSITRILNNCVGKYKVCDKKYVFKFEKDIKSV